VCCQTTKQGIYYANTARGIMLRRLLPYTTIALVITALYVCWVFFSRWQANRRIEQQRIDTKAAESRALLQKLGGGELKIVSFSATPATVTAGGRVLLCYGVNNAAAVRMNPPVDGVGPALSRCVETHPRHTTEYTITATDSGGHSVSEKLTVRVP
jgi:hypothetical protein